MSEDSREKERNFWASSHKPALSDTGKRIASTLNSMFGSGDEFHNVHTTLTEADTTPRVARTTVTLADKPRTSKKGFRMASEHSLHRPVNPSDALLPQDQSMMRAYQWAGDAIQSALGNHPLTHPDMSYIPVLRETGRQYQATWGEKANPNKTPAPYTDQSGIPLAQAFLRNPQNTLHENHARETGFDQGIEKGSPSSLGTDFRLGVLDNLLNTGQTLHNAGITGADILLELSGGDKTALDTARQNKIPLNAAIEKTQAAMKVSREQQGAPGSEEYRANYLVRQIAQGGGSQAVEMPKQYLTQGAGAVPELIATTSDLYHAYEEMTGEKRIGEAIKQGTTATAFYSTVYTEAQKAMERTPLPGFVKDYLAGSFAGNARNEFIKREMKEKAREW